MWKLIIAISAIVCVALSATIQIQRIEPELEMNSKLSPTNALTRHSEEPYLQKRTARDLEMLSDPAEDWKNSPKNKLYRRQVESSLFADLAAPILPQFIENSVRTLRETPGSAAKQPTKLSERTQNSVDTQASRVQRSVPHVSEDLQVDNIMNRRTALGVRDVQNASPDMQLPANQLAGWI